MIITGNRNFRDLLEHRNESSPENIFLIWEKAGVNYRELNRQTNQLSNLFLAMGVGKGDRVMIHLSNCPEFIYSLFALLKIGAVAVLSNINNVYDDLCYTLSHSESYLVISELEYYKLIREAQLKTPLLKKILLADNRENLPGGISLPLIIGEYSSELRQLSISPEDDACILYTSGTSGKPKGVLYSHGNMVFSGEVFSKQVRLGPSDRHLCVTPLFHNNALNHQLLPVVAAGASMVLYKKFSSSKFGAQIRENRVTITALPSPLLRYILNSPESSDESSNYLRVVCSGANLLTAQEYERFCRRFKVPITNWFGQTESVTCALHSPLDGKRKRGSVGLPTLGYEVQVVDENDREVSARSIGEIVIRGLGKHSVMKGYYKDTAATSLAFKGGWLHTGDLGFMDEEGYFYFVERKKEMIKVGGENVAASEVEMVLNQYSKIRDSAVIGVADELGNEAIKGFIVLREGVQASEGEIQEYCSEKMSKFKIPKYIEFLPELPRTAGGKIEKKMLRAREKVNK